MKNNYTIAVTGHRPNKLSNELYNVNSELSKTYIDWFKTYLICRIEEIGGTIICLSGMALGVDTLFAIAVLQLQNEGYSVELVACIPCLQQDIKWQSSSKKVYHAIMDRANEIVYVTNTTYTNNCMQLRNQYMVNRCDRLLAIWDGSYGGTGNCVKYGQSVRKPIDRVNPYSII